MKSSDACRDILVREWLLLDRTFREFPKGRALIDEGWKDLLICFFKRFFNSFHPFDNNGSLKGDDLSRLAASLLDELGPVSKTLAELLLLYPVYLREILVLEQSRTDNNRIRFKELDNRVSDYLKGECAAACEYLNDGEFSVATIRRYTVDLTRLSLFRKLLKAEEASYLSLVNVMDCLREQKSLGIPGAVSSLPEPPVARKMSRRVLIPVVLFGTVAAVMILVFTVGFGRSVSLSSIEIKTGSPDDTAEAMGRLQKLYLPEPVNEIKDSDSGDVAVIYIRKGSPIVSIVTARSTRTLLRERYLVLEGNGCSLSDAPVRTGTLSVLQGERVLVSEELPFEPCRFSRRDLPRIRELAGGDLLIRLNAGGDYKPGPRLTGTGLNGKLAPFHHFRQVIDLNDLVYSDGGAVVSVRLSAGDWAAVLTRLEISLAGRVGAH